MIQRLVIIVFFAIACLTVCRANTEIISGRANLTCGVDFSAQKCTSDPDSADVSLSLDGCWLPYSCIKQPYAYIGVEPDKSLGEVCGPPTTGFGCFGGHLDFCTDYHDVFVMQTKDGYWAKFAYTQLCVPSPVCCEILYFVQMDGTSNLCPVPVEESSWGEIKVLYE